MSALPTSPCTTCGAALSPYREPDGACGWRDLDGRSGGPRPGLEDGYVKLQRWGREIQSFKATRRTTAAEYDQHHRLILSYSALSVEVEFQGTDHVHRPTPGTEVDVVLAAMRFDGLTLDPPRSV